MKTVSGKFISSKPVSLSKAAKILSGFAGHEHGASDAVSVYLNLAADAFNNLVSFHKELKNLQSHFKHRTPRVKIEGDLDVDKVEIRESRKKSPKNADLVKIEEPSKVEEFRKGLVLEGNDETDLRNKRISAKEIDFGKEIGEKRRKKKHKREKVSNEEAIKIVQTRVLDECEKGKNSKQESAGIVQYSDEIEEGSTNEGQKGKRKKREGEEAGESLELHERKNMDGGETIDLAEQSRKKKKRKTERVV